MTQQETIDAFIEHYGVKGMKWGVRNRGRRASPPQTSDYKKTVNLRRRNPSTLTNRQLEIVNKRLNLEQNYSRMNPNTLKRGTMAAAGILATAKIGVDAYNVINSPAAKAARAAIKRG